MDLLSRLFARLERRTRSVVESSLFGLVAGLAAVVFEVAIARLYGETLVRFAAWTPLHFALASFTVLVGTALLSGVLLARVPEAAGSGIPQLKLAFWRDFGYVPARVAWVKFFAGILAVGGGSSLGREGPSVQLAGAITSNLSGWLGAAKTGRRRAAAAGAAAGLAATFNTPLAAIAFVLEEILGDLNSNLLGSVVVAAVLGAFMVHAILGSNPAFVLPAVNTSSWDGRVLVPVVALLASVLGVWFQRLALGLRRAFHHSRLRAVPPWCRPACGALVCWALGAAVFLGYGRLGVFSLGYDDLMSGLNGQLPGLVSLALLAAKFFATIFSYGSGGCGGIFAPCLFLGAMTGCALEEGACALGVPLTGDDRLLLMIIGMSSCLGAVVRAPCTSILIVFEMTREFSLVPALLVAGVLSQALSRWLEPHGFYEQVLEDDGCVLARVVPPRDFREWQRYPISAIANFQPVILPTLEPAGLRDALAGAPYLRFVVEQEDEPPAIILRPEAEAALAEGRLPELHAVPACLREDPILNAQRQLVESPFGIVLVLEQANGRVVGLLTLHDLLRAQQHFATQLGE